ncbi:MAG: L28 family ribosomal protein [Patescibacteria group bacterium]
MNRTKLYCQICLKSPQVGFNRPKSLHKTKRAIYPNLQKLDGLLICNRCRRSLAKAKPALAKV